MLMILPRTTKGAGHHVPHAVHGESCVFANLPRTEFVLVRGFTTQACLPTGRLANYYNNFYT